MELFTNTNYRRDFLRPQLEKWGKNTDILIASAFFNNASLVKEFSKKSCTVKLIIRLDVGTDANRLLEIIDLPNVYIRYFTGKRFHPKFYIFKNEIAFLGSSNLTDSGVMSNNEANVSIPVESPVYSDLVSQFEKYWGYARVLDASILKSYIEGCNAYQRKIDNLSMEIDAYIKHKFKIREFSDVDISQDKLNAKEEFIERYKQEYQLFLSNFAHLIEVYSSTGLRRIAEDRLPLRIEVDRFLDWLRDAKCHGSSYRDAKIRNGYDLDQNIIINIHEFIEAEYPYIENVAEENYPILNNALGSIDAIERLNEITLADVLVNVHAFHDQRRFVEGGYTSLIDLFIKKNGIDKIKKSLAYILHSTESDFMTRIANYIYDEDYKLVKFADSCVKEVYGWVNQEDIPIYNNRTYYSMRWLGFGSW